MWSMRPAPSRWDQIVTETVIQESLSSWWSLLVSVMPAFNGFGFPSDIHFYHVYSHTHTPEPWEEQYYLLLLQSVYTISTLLLTHTVHTSLALWLAGTHPKQMSLTPFPCFPYNVSLPQSRFLAKSGCLMSPKVSGMEEGRRSEWWR
jgi:hypothetical protein